MGRSWLSLRSATPS
ncbi:unnamed protein product [Linum tenue]|uniref:Uncharacterized protein n=1 Tax=Linum tenue TaxID=586396 RepID=A0AAV0HBE5_9ROSI|nr:unnamed protein product [Linum tenue]